MVDWIVPLLIGLLGGPPALVIKLWYKKKEDKPSKFADSGTYVRDDSLYSYDNPNPSEDEGSENTKNNS